MPDIRPSLIGLEHMVKNIPYPEELPDYLQECHVYLVDSGHCIMAFSINMMPKLLFHVSTELKNNGKESNTVRMKQVNTALYNYEVPIPVKYVLEHQNWPFYGHVISDYEYSPTIGAIIPDGYDEF